jgi:hypothetical protein
VTPFVSLERTRELAVLAAHARIVTFSDRVHDQPWTEEDARELRVLVGIINDAEELELKKYVIGRRTGEAPRPDPEKAQAIAQGQEPTP